MHSLSADQLIDHENHAWDELMQLFTGGRHTYMILPVDRGESRQTLERLQISTRSYLGAIAYETGGVLVDHGWIKLLGSGAPGIYGSLRSWNGLHEQPVITEIPGMLTVAYDAAGGFFALDTGRFGQTGHIYYFAPDTLEWESTELAYSGFINWLAVGDLQQFYDTFRWEGWQSESSQLGADRVLSYYPPLWTKEGGGQNSYKSPISIREAWELVLEQYQDEQAQQKRQTDIINSNTVSSSEVSETEHHIDEIEQHYSICFPLDYLAFVRQSGDQAYQFTEEGGQTDWEIHFSALDGQFIANNQAMVNDVNPDPQRIIPIAWSMSSGNNYLLDYRYNPAEPAVLLLEHEEAMVREDAEAEADSPEEAQQLLEGNVRKVADHFGQFATLIKQQ
ncbi:DUF2625 family protein [Paenibacillus sp. WLX2291]|uniref:DUF2625 family protein n=1 Tax=Paenibacillus sp. WLX2291 TaxID=3296934 RepID=UPI0039843C98